MLSQKQIVMMVLLATGVILQACKPKPLDIEVAAFPRQMAISSSVIDRHTLFLTATYSINSLTNLNDTSANATPQALADEALVKDGTAILSSSAGTQSLTKISEGVYGSYSLDLQPFTTYILSVKDNNTGTTVTATTTYVPLTRINELTPSVKRNLHDTIVNMHLSIVDDPTRADYYLMSYSRISPATIPSPIGGSNFSIVNFNTGKTLELFTDADAIADTITRDFELNIAGDDTLYVNVGRIDKGYYEFLTAYKRTGNFISQLTGEPITLPTNIATGFGYFNLYEAHRERFFLKNY